MTDPHSIATLYFEWKAAITENLGILPNGFEKITSQHVLLYLEQQLQDRREIYDSLAQDVQRLKEIAK